MGFTFSVHPYTDEHERVFTPGRYKIVHLIRHAQGQHNAAVSATGSEEEYKNWAWHDSRLTDIGVGQASALRPTMEKHTIDVVFVSPLSRAIKTGLLAIPEGPPFIVEDLLRERIGTHPCDKRRSRAEIKADFPSVDVSTLEYEEDEKWSEAREPWADVSARAEAVLEKLRARAEARIAVVTHNDFLTALLHESALRVADASLRIYFKNAQHLPVVLTWEEAHPAAHVAATAAVMEGAAAAVAAPTAVVASA